MRRSALRTGHVSWLRRDSSLARQWVQQRRRASSKLPPEVAAMPEPTAWGVISGHLGQVLSGYGSPTAQQTRMLSQVDREFLEIVKEDADTVKYDDYKDMLPHFQEFPQYQDFMLTGLLPVRPLHALMEFLLLECHIPIWVTIALIPPLIRSCVVIPYAIKNQRQYEALLPKMPAAMAAWNSVLVRVNRDRKEYNKEVKDLKKQYGFNPYFMNWLPFKPLLLMLPIHWTMYISLRTIYPRLEEARFDGIGPFTDLTQITHSDLVTFGTMGVTLIAVYKISQKYHARPERSGKQTAVYSAIACALVYSSTVGSTNAINLYLLSNLVTYVITASMFENDKVRNAFGLENRAFIKNYQRLMIESVAEAESWTAPQTDPRAKDRWASARLVLFEDAPKLESGIDWTDVEHDSPVQAGESVKRSTEKSKEEYLKHRDEWMKEHGYTEENLDKGFFKFSKGFWTRTADGGINPTRGGAIDLGNDSSDSKSNNDNNESTDGQSGETVERVIIHRASRIPRHERRRLIKEYEYDFEGAAQFAQDERDRLRDAGLPNEILQHKWRVERMEKDQMNKQPISPEYSFLSDHDVEFVQNEDDAEMTFRDFLAQRKIEAEKRKNNPIQMNQPSEQMQIEDESSSVSSSSSKPESKLKSYD